MNIMNSIVLRSRRAPQPEAIEFYISLSIASVSHAIMRLSTTCTRTLIALVYLYTSNIQANRRRRRKTKEEKNTRALPERGVAKTAFNYISLATMKLHRYLLNTFSFTFNNHESCRVGIYLFVVCK